MELLYQSMPVIFNNVAQLTKSYFKALIARNKNEEILCKNKKIYNQETLQ